MSNPNPGLGLTDAFNNTFYDSDNADFEVNRTDPNHRMTRLPRFQRGYLTARVSNPGAVVDPTTGILGPQTPTNNPKGEIVDQGSVLPVTNPNNARLHFMW